MSDPGWRRAMDALALLAVDPAGLGGLALRARAGPVRQTFESTLARIPGPQRRIHTGLSDIQLFGGLNVAASLTEGRAVREAGLAESPALLVLTMAERSSAALAGRLAQLLDAGRGHTLVMLDEGAEAEERAPEALIDRLAFYADLSDVAQSAARMVLPAPADIDAARASLSSVEIPEDAFATLTLLALQFGIASLRAPLFAVRAARARAALDGRTAVDEDDLRAAAELVYPHRATQVPQMPQETTPEDEPPPEEDQGETGGDDSVGALDDQLIEAVLARVPADLLAQLQLGARARGGQGSGAGEKRRGNRRGRPLPSRPGRLDGRARIDVVATLRAAAPWQPIRRRARGPGGPKLIIHPGDIRLKRYEDRSDRLLIFAVDASGSAAMARLAEAKGAVEMLLAQAYARRDHVAVVAFRGDGAELLLPPTRSLVQAKRRLSSLPGGGGTPLAAGIAQALTLAQQSRGRGLTPALVLLTDGRANVGLSGAAGRAAAMDDAHAMARASLSQGVSAMVIDTATRPGEASAALAGAMDAVYFALPRAEAEAISAAVSAALN